MHTIQPERDQRYERMFDTSDKQLARAVSCCGMSRFALFRMYVDNAPEGESLHTWLTIEFRINPLEAAVIPEYTSAEDILEHIASVGPDSVSGAMTEERLFLTGVALALPAVETVDITQTAA